MSRVVHLHIGAPKTGTTYLQDRLMLNASTLADHGVTIPARNRFIDIDRFHFQAALDLVGQDWGGAPGHADGAWELMVRRVRRAEGNVVISHEILAAAKPDRIARAMNDLAGEEVHIVYSARDLGRQLPAAWQESIKQGRRWSFGRFLNQVEAGRTWWTRAMDLPTVLANWGAKLPPERIHVVTVPHERGPHGDALWLRFCEAFGIDPAWAPKDSERANASLGIAEAQVLRRLNRRLNLAVRHDYAYDQLVLEMLAHEVLAGRRSKPVRLPPDRYDFADHTAQLWIDWLHGSGVDVVGDPEDLRPRRPAPDARWHDPDRVPPQQLLWASQEALTAMVHVAAQRKDHHGLAAKVRHQARRMREQ